MSDEFESNEVEERIQRLFAALPRESAPEPRELDHLVTAEGSVPGDPGDLAALAILSH